MIRLKLILIIQILIVMDFIAISQTQCEIYKGVLEFLNEKKSHSTIKIKLEDSQDSIVTIEQYKYFIVSSKTSINQNDMNNISDSKVKNRIKKKLTLLDLDSISKCSFIGKTYAGFIKDKLIHIKPNYEISSTDSIGYFFVLVKFSEILSYKKVHYLGMHLGHGLHNHPGDYYYFKVVKRKRGYKIKIVDKYML